ncbi:MAG: hypothetical protein O3A92_16375 [Verrucomicrobia bacterium]|nr:hypothetical protein [Verrucomicrobiota bacterium]
MTASDFPAGTKFFEVDGIPIAWAPGAEPVGVYGGTPRPLSEKTSMKLATEGAISPEYFGDLVARSMASKAASL